MFILNAFGLLYRWASWIKPAALEIGRPTFHEQYQGRVGIIIGITGGLSTVSLTRLPPQQGWPYVLLIILLIYLLGGAAYLLHRRYWGPQEI